ncbi:hypothetical protein PDJAM_G00088160 [Pangasius djambal]|uniref:Uncharacterized protein n=1 Tax=Pangasius djambal TaxID=1691987 RepID=A0ACC5Z735_9TELE|nr:hypothetical protein [Pangasius djambal]
MCVCISELVWCVFSRPQCVSLCCITSSPSAPAVAPSCSSASLCTLTDRGFCTTL